MEDKDTMVSIASSVNGRAVWSDPIVLSLPNGVWGSTLSVQRVSMSQELLAIIILLIVIIPIVKRVVDKNKGKREAPQAEDASVEMEKVFLDKVQNGSSSVRLTTLYGQTDVMLIKSILQSEQIPYRVEFENITRLRTGFALGDFYGSVLYVLEEDRDDAMKVLDAYKRGAAAPADAGTSTPGEIGSD